MLNPVAGLLFSKLDRLNPHLSLFCQQHTLQNPDLAFAAMCVYLGLYLPTATRKEWNCSKGNNYSVIWKPSLVM